MEGAIGAVILLQAHRRGGAGREGTEKWAHDILAGVPRPLCGASWVPWDGQWPVDVGEAGNLTTS